MSKIICDICGSRYPDTSAQCPICGCINSKTVRMPEMPQVSAAKADLPERTATPGGRFSKSNVSKRNQGKVFHDEPDARTKPAGKREKPQAKPQVRDDFDLEKEFEEETGKKRGSLVNVLLVVVIIALLGVCAYIFIQFFMPSFFGSDPVIAPTEQPTVAVTEAPTEAPAPTLPPNVSCEKLTMDEGTIVLTEAGQTHQLNIQVFPENTTDGLIYISSNEEVATVGDDGQITAVGEGSVVITVFCGGQQLECNIVCNFSGAPVTEPGEQPTEETPAETEAPAQTGVEKTVTSNNLNIREEAGAKKKKVGSYKKGDVIIIFEEKKVSGQNWGRTDKGWVCMDYVK